MASLTGIQRIDEAGSVQLLQKRVVEKVLRFYLRPFRTLHYLQDGLDDIFGHERHALKNRLMFVVDGFEQPSVIGLHVFGHHLRCRLFIAVDDGDRLGVASEIAAYGVRLLLDGFARGDDGDEDKRNIQVSDIENMLEPQFFGLKCYWSAHESGSGVA